MSLLLAPVAVRAAAASEERAETTLRRPIAEMIALSPDGQRIAYTAHETRGLTIVVRSIEPPGAKRVIPVEPERAREAAGAANALATALAPVSAPAPATTQLRFLRWATADRIVFAPAERIVPLPPVVDKQGRSTPNPDGPTIISPILVADAAGQERGMLVDAPQFQETPADARRTLGDFLRTTKELAATRNEAVRWRMPHVDILGFLPHQRDQLIIQTRGAYSMPLQHLVDIRTGNVRDFGQEWAVPPGEPHVYDSYRLKVVGERRSTTPRPITAWQDKELAGIQRALETKFPRRLVEILDWSETRTRVLCRVTKGGDAGRIFVWQRTEDLMLEVLACGPTPTSPTSPPPTSAPEAAR